VTGKDSGPSGSTGQYRICFYFDESASEAHDVEATDYH
jgi:plasmid maintenance system killer protein